MWLEKKKKFQKRITSYVTDHVLVHKFGRWYCKNICRKEYESQSFCKINERSIEYRFVLQALSQTCPTTVLDIGTGTTALPHIIRTCGFVVTAVDNIYDYWPEGMFNRHFHVINDDITNTTVTKTFDLIICVSVLEHVQKYEVAINTMFTFLNPGGYLVLTFPYNEKKYIENVYKLPGAGYGQDAPYICQVFSRNDLDSWLQTNNATILEQEYWQVFDGDFWTFGKHIYPPHQVDKHEKHQLTCVLIQKQS